jgi:hypothetical protein
LLVVLYGCEKWSFRLREGRRLKLFENRVLRRIFRPKVSEKKNYIMRNLIICSPNSKFFGRTYQEE